MKPFLIVTLLCFSMLFAVASAQDPIADSQRLRQQEPFRYATSPKGQIDMEANNLAVFRAAWNGQGTFIPLTMMLQLGSEAELGVTDEQKQRLSYLQDHSIGDKILSEMQRNPSQEFSQVMEAIQTTTIPGDPFFERATDAQKIASREAYATMINFVASAIETEIQETLTPEQLLQIRKLEMQMMSEMGIPFPSMFDPLDPTDAQKKEMNEVTNELKAEFESYILEFGALQSERLVSIAKTLQEQSFASNEERQAAFQEQQRQFVPTEEMRRRAADLRERGTRLITTLQTRLMDVLTDEQLVKMQAILDATPEFAKKLLAKHRAQREAVRQSPTYIPGPDSWRPGDPVPVQFKEERQRRRFPRTE